MFDRQGPYEDECRHRFCEKHSLIGYRTSRNSRRLVLAFRRQYILSIRQIEGDPNLGHRSVSAFPKERYRAASDIALACQRVSQSCGLFGLHYTLGLSQMQRVVAEHLPFGIVVLIFV
jgi:hypothetical protein